MIHSCTIPIWILLTISLTSKTLSSPCFDKDKWFDSRDFLCCDNIRQVMIEKNILTSARRTSVEKESDLPNSLSSTTQGSETTKESSTEEIQEKIPKEQDHGNDNKSDENQLEKIRLLTETITKEKDDETLDENEPETCITIQQILKRTLYNKCCLEMVVDRCNFERANNISECFFPDLDDFLKLFTNPTKLTDAKFDDKCLIGCFLIGTGAMNIDSQKIEENHINTKVTKHFSKKSSLFTKIDAAWKQCIRLSETQSVADKNKDNYLCLLAARFYACILTQTGRDLAGKKLDVCEEDASDEQVQLLTDLLHFI